MFRKADEALRGFLDVELPIYPFNSECLEKIRIYGSGKEIRRDVVLSKEAIREIEYGLRRQVEEFPWSTYDEWL